MKIITRLMFVFTVAAAIVLAAQIELQAGALGGVLDATYLIEKQEIHLIGGRAEAPAAPGSAAKITTAVFGKPVYGDLDGDGRDDAALFLVQNPGGSGTFYYVAAAIAKKGIFQGTNAVLLGDRIGPRKIQIRDRVIVADYADRHPGQSMAAPPSIDKTMYLTLKEGHLEAVKAPR
jgi:hypothetical protein